MRSSVAYMNNNSFTNEPLFYCLAPVFMIVAIIVSIVVPGISLLGAFVNVFLGIAVAHIIAMIFSPW